MHNNIDFKYNPDIGIMIKIHYGKISLDVIKNSWEWAFSNKIIPEDTKLFILDYSNALLDFGAKNHENITNYYKSKPEYFAGKKFAIISNNPHNVVISTLVHRDDSGYESRPFSTVEAAIKWLKNE